MLRYLLGSVVWLAGCTALGPRVGAVIPSSPEIAENATWVAAADVAGNFRLAYYDDKNQIHVMDRTGRIVQPFHPDGHDRASSGLALQWVGSAPFVAFRDKSPQRNVFVGNPEKGSQVVGLDPGNLPLARITMVPRAASLGVLWYGERPAEGETYHVYYREIGQDGNPLTDEPVRLFPGIYPVAAATASGKVLAVSWVKSQQGTGYEIVARLSTKGSEFGPPMVLAQTDVIRPIFKAIALDEGFLVLWYTRFIDENGESAYKLQGARSSDGQQWVPLGIPDLAGHDIESLDIASDTQGNVAIAVGLIKPGESVAKGKRWAYLITSHDRGATWAAPIDLRHDPVQKDMPYSHARTPKVAFLGDGQLLVAWQDWRTLRAGIRYSFSEDAGRTWRVLDQPLTGGVDSNERFDVTAPSIFPVGDGKALLVVERLNGDLLTAKTLNVLEVDVHRLRRADFMSSGVSAPDIDRLRQRAQAFWRAMAERDHETVYRMFDPYFRARVSLDDYRRNSGRIEYSNPSVEQVDVIGPLGAVIAKTTVEVKPIRMQGRVMKLDPVEKEIPTRWIWIDGDWYHEFYLESRDYRYTPF